MIIGIGTDILSITRIKDAINKFGDRFLNRIFTKEELFLYKNLFSEKRKIGFLAKRFAAKEAFAKALGFGIGKNISFTDISIINDKHNKPMVMMNSTIDNLLKKISNGAEAHTIHISLSDDNEFANAMVIIEKHRGI
jgi:holo-[acyl-carrier protein] synthase